MKIKLKDKELVKKFIEGDKSALEVLIKRHKERVYTYIFFIVKNEKLAEDIFQDTFIKVIKSLRKGKYNEQGVFVSWVIRIAHNLTIDYFRKDSRMPTYSNDVNSEIDIFNSKRFSEETIEDEMIKKQIAADVRNLVEELPNEQKEVILLRHFGNLSFREIAEQTNVSINTALGRMRYALINLRKLIEEKNLNLSVF
ncbi:MAG: sigma-70 family RNA polymerase sigma factor [Bacteroidales bacterium]|nr:sigma-70 family RNA polymerase sigma factor [Bacteroidales bacterium]